LCERRQQFAKQNARAEIPLFGTKYPFESRNSVALKPSL